MSYQPLDNDMVILKDNGNHPIVISSIIKKFLVERILVDGGSAVEVLIFDAFKKMRLDDSILRPTGPIYGFANQSIKVKGLITVHVTLGQGKIL